MTSGRTTSTSRSYGVAGLFVDRVSVVALQRNQPAHRLPHNVLLRGTCFGDRVFHPCNRRVRALVARHTARSATRDPLGQGAQVNER